MPLAAGDRLGLYEIVAPLGAGGMGEVYRARDTRLDRVVAIKVLPEAFAADPERLARFEREARLLASLNHPNIAVLHGLEIDGGRRFIAMEFVDGVSLAQRLISGPLPLDEALDVARQVATALEAAHDGGVVHRDLKPGNVMLRPDGTVKVLDFGLAKGTAGSPSDSSLSMSPTQTYAMTGDGVILGTAAYMSPEQARGKPVDRRTDIWAFGCVLFECLTGRQAFEGETVSDMIASILKGEIAWSELPAALPPRVLVLLERCLERDARQRLRDIGEARLVLEQPGAHKTPGATPATAPARAGLPMAMLLGAALLVSALAALAAWTLKPAPRHTTTWAELTPPADMRWQADAAGDGAVSPDGRWYAASVLDSAGTRRLSVRDLESGGARLLENTRDARYPFWSPDAKSLGFFVPGKLQRVDLEGNAVTTLAPAGDGRGGSWNTRGQIVFAPTSRSGLHLVSASGGEVRVLLADSLGGNYRFPHFLPDGRHFAVGLLSASSTSALEIHSLDGGEPRKLPLAETVVGNVYYQSGHLYYCEDQVLRARPFDPGRAEFTGDAITVTTPVAVSPARGRADFSVGGNGTIVFRSERVNEKDQITVRDRTGALIRAIPGRGALQDLQLSPDGTRLATSMSAERNGGVDVWLFDITRGTELRLTFNDSSDDPAWSPDGKQVAWASNNGVFTRAADGVGEPVTAFQGSEDFSPTQWVNANTLLMTGPGVKTPGKADAVWELDPTSGQARELIGGPGAVRFGQVSADGHWIAYATQSGSRPEVFVMDYPGLKSRWQVSSGGGYTPRWRGDGRELYFLDLEEHLVATSIEASGSSLVIGTPRVLFKQSMAQHVVNRVHSWAPDPKGQLFYMLEPAVVAERRPTISLVRGWTPPSAAKR
ncbi:MAG: serine/threonine-protein kinase [Candidatus Eisenbacteria bacterium]|nr:serine/threonine-protein kinase [Candidatus Eisenbacteria bacterium]